MIKYFICFVIAMTIQGDFFICTSCNNYFTKDQTQVDFQGIKIRGCPKCKRLDFLKAVSQGEYMQAIATKKFTQGNK